MTGFLAASLAAAPLLVLSSDEPLLAPGMVLDSERIDLSAGRSLTVLTASGRKATLQGPHRGAWPQPIAGAGADDAARVAALSSLLVSAQGRTSSVGAVRNLPRGAAPTYAPDLQLLSLAAPGVQCLAARSSHGLWRPPGMPVRQVTIQIGDAPILRLDWPDGDRLPLPDSLQLADDAILLVQVDEQPPARIQVRLIASGSPTDRNDLVAAIVWMGRNQCEEQARQALRTLAAAD